MPQKLTLISHLLCPYVQRAAIALAEKGVPYERINIDLANKPDWFLAISPLGKVPVLLVDNRVIFESAVILEYLDEALPKPLHPADIFERAENRSWIEFGSAVLSDLWGFYTAPDRESFEAKATALEQKFARIEARLGDGPWFGGADFSLVDAVFAPALRYFDVLDTIGDFGILTNKPKVAAWRQALAARPSVRGAVTADYPDLLQQFFVARDSYLSGLIAPEDVRRSA